MADVPQLWTGKKRDLTLLAVRLLVDDPRRAREVAAELCALEEADGDTEGIVSALYLMARAARAEGAFDLARTLLDRAYELQPASFICGLRAFIEEDAATRCSAIRDRVVRPDMDAAFQCTDCSDVMLTDVVRVAPAAPTDQLRSRVSWIAR